MGTKRHYIGLDKSDIQYILDNAYTKSPREIAEWIGCTTDAIRYHLKKRGIKTGRFDFWNAERNAKLVQMYKDGANVGEIADLLKVTPHAVYMELSILRQKGYNIPYRRKI